MPVATIVLQQAYTLGTESSNVNPIAQWSIRLLGFAATVAVTVYITKIARRALQETVTELP